MRTRAKPAPPPQVKPRLVIVQMDPGTPPGKPELGSNAKWFADALDRYEPDVTVVRAFAGEQLPEDIRNKTATGPIGIISSGGGGFVTERAPWLMEMGEQLVDAATKYPTFAVCLSEQLVAQTLGGKVDFMPKGEAGTQRITILNHEDPIFSGISGKTFDANESHLQAVVEPPPGAEVLASNEAGIQAIKFGPDFYGMQFHPEMTAPIADGYGRGEHEVRPTPDAAAVLHNFIDYSVLGKE